LEQNSVKALPNRIQRLLNADEDNLKKTTAVLAGAEEYLVEAFHETAALFNQVIDSFNREHRWKELVPRLDAIAAEHGITKDQLRENSEQYGVASMIDEVVALSTNKILLRMCERYWALASAEILRLRVSPAHGYVRLQAEAVGLMKLFLGNHPLAKKWWNIQDDEDGKAFFGKTNKKIYAELKRWGLNDSYEISSAVAHHVRPASFVRNLNLDNEVITLPDQEFQRPASFYLTVWYFHRMQARVLAAILDANFGEREPEVLQRVRAFESQVTEHARAWKAKNA
jgi:hypothetical protein